MKKDLLTDNPDQQMLGWADDELVRRLSAKGLLPDSIREKALTMSRENRTRLAETLVSLNVLPKQVVYEELAGIYGVPYVDLTTYNTDPMVVSLVDEKLARELTVFPLFTIGESLTVACVDPGDITAMDRISSASNCNVEACLAPSEDIHDAINRAYGSSGKIKDFLDGINEAAVPGTMNMEAQKAVARGNESPVSQLVDLIVMQAVRDRASDIHLDPEETNLRIRFRIDGILYEIPPPPKYLHPFIISRVKVMSNMDIAESRIPQDGHFNIKVDGRFVEARVASMPTIHGENLTIRLLDTEMMAIPLENLGMPASMLPKVYEMIQRPHGMVVTTGPTGSGKSTTLNALLTKAISSERHIITIEDPVEQRMRMISQAQVNEKAGLTFAAALRSILRQDPDVIMVGEIRDQETAQLAVRAALTGHLIFSTIHTNDAPGAVTRLVNMGIEPFLLSSSLVGVIAQRLVRRICEDCKVPHKVSDKARKRLAASGVAIPTSLWNGKGCQRCRHTGYRGRIGLYELMWISQKLSDLISMNVPVSQLREQARKEGMPDILQDGLKKAGAGSTTIEEVLKVCELEFVSDSTLATGHTVQKDKTSVVAENVVIPEEKGSLNLDDYKSRISNWLGSK